MAEEKPSKSRRDTLRFCVGAAVAGLGPGPELSEPGRAQPAALPADEALDEALRLLQDADQFH